MNNPKSKIQNPKFIKRGKPMPSLAQKWLEQGMQQGLQQGMQQGLQQGMQQGMVREAQEMVLEAIEAKFGVVPRILKEKIVSLSDRDLD